MKLWREKKCDCFYFCFFVHLFLLFSCFFFFFLFFSSSCTSFELILFILFPVHICFVWGFFSAPQTPTSIHFSFFVFNLVICHLEIFLLEPCFLYSSFSATSSFSNNTFNTNSSKMSGLWTVLIQAATVQIVTNDEVGSEKVVLLLLASIRAEHFFQLSSIQIGSWLHLIHYQCHKSYCHLRALFWLEVRVLEHRIDGCCVWVVMQQRNRVDGKQHMQSHHPFTSESDTLCSSPVGPFFLLFFFFFFFSPPPPPPPLRENLPYI